jgi:hypothetical protein
MLKYDGIVDQYLNPNDYSLTETGAASKVADTNFGGSAMMEWPKIYTKRWEDEDGIYHFRCSDRKIDDSWECWCNKNSSDDEVDHFYTSIYTATEGMNVSLRALSGGSPVAGNPASRGNLLSGALSNGDGWNLEMLVDRLLIQDLLVMISKSTDTQESFGYGYGGTSMKSSGSMDQKGLFWGENKINTSGNFDYYDSGVKVFGMEYWWGNVARFMYDWYRDGSSFTQYLLSDNNKITGPVVDVGYISNMKTYPFGRIPSGFSGSAATHECDYVTRTNTTGTYYAAVGRYDAASITYGLGAFCVCFEKTNTNYSSRFGTSLSYK